MSQAHDQHGAFLFAIFMTSSLMFFVTFVTDIARDDLLRLESSSPSWHHSAPVTHSEVSQRMAKQAVARTVDLEPIDRLEEKIKLLVAMVARLRADQARAVEEQSHLMQEIDTLRARLADAESTNIELTALREERDVIRARVTEMLSHLDGLVV